MAYANPDALVTTEWLKENLSDPNIRVIEVDEDATVYDKDHIPGAIAWSWSDDLHHETRREPAEAYKAFRGRLPGIGALLKKRGLDVSLGGEA